MSDRVCSQCKGELSNGLVGAIFTAEGIPFAEVVACSPGCWTKICRKILKAAETVERNHPEDEPTGNPARLSHE